MRKLKKPRSSEYMKANRHVRGVTDPTPYAKYMYKCRLCGATFFDGLESGVARAERTLQDIAIFGKDVSGDTKIYGENAVGGMMVSMVTVHQCHGTYKMGAEGLADLIGYMIDNN